MKDTALYEQLLGLKTPWSVKRVELSMADQRVTVEVALKGGQVWADPTNERARAHINGWSEHEWRHLDTCQFKTVIKARVPQLKYSDGRVEELTVPWAGRYARVTTLMEACPNTKNVCSLTGLSWHTVNAIMLKGVERGMARRQAETIEHLGLDEKSTERGHSYASILTDIDRSRVLDVVPGRKLENATELLQTLTPEQRTGVKAVDSVRRREHRVLLRTGASPLTGSKYAWMKAYADGRSSEAVSFRALNQLNLKTSRAWRIKETFSHFWGYRQQAAAQRYFRQWSNHAMRSRLEPVKRVVKMLRRHETGLLNYAKHRISNACAEGFNSAIQLIKANARGFRSFINYRARILFHCGKLEMGLG
jgi:transposase